MNRSAHLRSAIAAAIALSTLSIAQGCGPADSTSLFAGPDAAVDDGGRNPPGCPVESPRSGAPCALPSGTRCSYGGTCSASAAFCTSGRWELTSAPAIMPTCPEFVPSEGEACCVPADQRCPYDCAHGNGANREASCVGHRWSVASLLSPCTSAAACARDQDCDTCAESTGCVCTAVSASRPRSLCTGTSQCAQNPCTGKRAACVAGTCQLASAADAGR